MKEKGIVEVTVDVDKILRGRGSSRSGGRIDYDEDDKEYLLAEAKCIIDSYSGPVGVIVAGAIPHWMLVHLQHVIEVTEKVYKYDFVPLGSAKITVFDYTTAEVEA
ncbi:hypothetical protein [Methanococcoides sp. AM1]|uniref:hypothetical protein n=1 Tax=Methanococcoides sp. AM1 TaxID=1201011 RepID=UPI001082F314|nr:hypothetical protein [Methanococcoides sp. AM1]